MADLSRYNKYFGGGRGAAERAFASMRKTYGNVDGERVFYARVAKLKRRDSRRGRRR